MKEFVPDSDGFIKVNAKVVDSMVLTGAFEEKMEILFSDFEEWKGSNGNVYVIRGRTKGEIVNILTSKEHFDMFNKSITPDKDQ